MRNLKIRVAVLFALIAGATAALGQWPTYSTPGPRTADGKSNT